MITVYTRVYVEKFWTQFGQNFINSTYTLVTLFWIKKMNAFSSWSLKVVFWLKCLKNIFFLITNQTNFWQQKFFLDWTIFLNKLRLNLLHNATDDLPFFHVMTIKLAGSFFWLFCLYCGSDQPVSPRTLPHA